MRYSLKTCSITAAVVMAASTQFAMADATIFNNIPGTLDHSYYSLGYQATQTSEFGSRIDFGGTARDLTSVTVTMVDWAKQEDYDPSEATTGFYHDFTFNIYAAGSGYSHGALLGSVTQTKFVPYRPTGWDRNGYAFNMSFDLTGLSLTAPDSIVYGLAFNTQSYGASPMGSAGAYNSLNFGVNDAAGGGVTVGSTDLDTVFLNTSTAGWYTDGGANGVGIFRMDTAWTGYAPMVEFSATPAPGAAALFGLAGMLGSRRRRF